MKTRRQCKKYSEAIPLHCYTNMLILRLIISNRKTHQIHRFPISKQNFILTIYMFMHLCIIISALFYLIHFLSMHKSLVYPPSVHILYDECNEDVTGKYSSAKFQWRNWHWVWLQGEGSSRKDVALFKVIQKWNFPFTFASF